MNTDYDVIIIGAGGAGLAAAATAIELGAKVAVLEAGDKVGGSTALSAGIFYAAGTSVQRKRGVANDTADAMYDYYMTLNQYNVDAALAKRLCDNAADSVEWLIARGVEFDPAKLYASGVDGNLRGHAPTGNGAGIIAALDAWVSGKCDIALRTRVQDLAIENGRVVGVRVGGETIRAKAVIIATGGFGANPELLARHYPEAAAHHDWAWYIGTPNAQGDGLKLGSAAGADIVGHNRGLLLATTNFVKELEVYMPGWLAYVNRDGRRFVDETIEYAVMSGVIKEQPNSECFGIFDEALRATAAPSPYAAQAVREGRAQTSWVPDRLAEYIRQGKILKADTLEELARKAGIRWPALGNSIERYNRDVAAGADTAYFKAAENLKPITQAPFYAARIRAATVCLTSTGLRIDVQGRVLDGNDDPIAGLFAAGETTGNVLGSRYIGGGNSIANAVTGGRAAARTAVLGPANS